ncbi:serine hydrolase [Actinophytocola sp. S1-96]|uniref:Serine hydrolase n=1 Tax=Actinophytocola gossypii TaxID=2812003 RepID=A0ABT2J9S0_9PSEU|nr:serine hydrolase [Actinophytocola gossypii]
MPLKFTPGTRFGYSNAGHHVLTAIISEVSGQLYYDGVLGVFRGLGVVSFPLPQNARQVPQEALRRNVARGALRFGFEMGTGMRAYVSATVPYVLVVALLLTAPGIVTVLAAGVGFRARQGDHAHRALHQPRR